jgi:hypothetical protein
LTDWQDEPVTCPFLDATHGTCPVYNGNQGAIERALHQPRSEVKSLVEWLEGI